MMSIKFATNIFYLILQLLLSSYVLQDCLAGETSLVSKDAAVSSLNSSPILKHLIRTGTLYSDEKVAKTVSETEVPDKELQNYSYEVHKDTEINGKGKYLGTNSNTDDLDVRRNGVEESVSSKNATIDLSKLVYSKLANALKNRLHRMIAQAFPKYEVRSNSSDVHLNMTSESTGIRSENISNISNRNSVGIPKSNSKEQVQTGRQFVFHPYLPYGKDVAPDEKISIGDVLPVKMVKFFKGMVEDAPWEQMFQKMVRMIVDQFVDKIIEKMFSHKDDEHDEWRSLDGGSPESAWSLPKNVLTFVARSRRSTEGKAKSEHAQDRIEKDSSSANRVSKEDRSKTKEPTGEESWLDSILDYLFPDDPKAADDSEEDRRKKRDTDQPSRDSNGQMSRIMRGFLARYLKFNTEQLSPESMNAIVKDSIRHRMSETVPPGDSKLSSGAISSMPKNTISGLPLVPKLTESVDAPATSSSRAKRSATDGTDKEEDEERLWQANRRTRPSNRKSREDCSLRRACNAGRLLSRLPSVQDITMQLKAYGNEPHWDALLWGMTKKRCSKIFCRRHRSPKGTKHHWDGPPEKRLLRKSTPSSRSSRPRHDESDLTTIYPV